MLEKKVRPKGIDTIRRDALVSSARGAHARRRTRVFRCGGASRSTARGPVSRTLRICSKDLSYRDLPESPMPAASGVCCSERAYVPILKRLTPPTDPHSYELWLAWQRW